MKTIKAAILWVFILSFNLAFAQSDVHLEKGNKLFERENYKEAVIEYSKSIEFDEKNINAYLQRAMCYNILKEYEKSVSDYNEVLSFQPDLLVAKNSRGSAYMKLKNYKKAMLDFDDIIEADPKDSEAYNNRGWCKKRSGDKEGACKDWKTSKKLGNTEAKIILKNNGC